MQFPDPAAAYLGVFSTLVAQKPMTRSNDRFMFWDVEVEVNQLKPNIDILSFGYDEPARWLKFVREYVDVDQLFTMKEKVDPTKYREVGYTCPLRATHSLGNCLVGFSLRHKPKRQITMFSRMSEWVPVGAIDLAFAAALSEFFGGGFSLRWLISALSLHSLKSIPLIDAYNITLPETEFSRSVDENRSEISNLSANSSYRLYSRYNDKINNGRTDKPPFYPSLPLQREEYSGGNRESELVEVKLSISDIEKITGAGQKRIRRELRKLDLFISTLDPPNMVPMHLPGVMQLIDKLRVAGPDVTGSPESD